MTEDQQKKLMNEMTNLCIEKIRKDSYKRLFISGFETQYPSKDFIPGAITPIYVKWRWLDRILIKIFKPFIKIT
jgi:menaquinone-dependent protoporphyrinogen IX oxidase